MTFRQPERVRIVGFAGDAPGCGDRASSWELVRLLHEIWPAGEPFDLRTGRSGDAPADGRSEIVLVQGGATHAPSGHPDVPVLPVNEPPGATTDGACADTAILTDPLEHGSFAESLGGRGCFCVVADAWRETGAEAALARIVDEVARITGLVPVIVPTGRPERPDRGAALGAVPGLVMPIDTPHPAAAHLLGTAAFVLGGDPRLTQMAAITGTPSVPVAADRAAIAGVRRMLKTDWPIRAAGEVEAIVADVRGLQAEARASRERLRQRCAALREETRAALRRRLERVTPTVPAQSIPTGWNEAAPPPQILPQLVPLTIYLRRSVRPVPTFRCLRQLIEGNLPDVLGQLDSRWLVSVCDSYADHGDPLVARNALLVSTFLSWERLAATHARWSDPGRASMTVDAPPPETNVALWDGLITIHLRRGDTVNNLLVRYARMLTETPVILAIWRELLGRIRAHDSVLAALDRPHGHLFDERLDWMADPRLEGVPRWRRPGSADAPRSTGP